MSSSCQTSVREWHKQISNTPYLISTDPTKLDHGFIADAFTSPDMYWAKEIPRDALELMLHHSVTLGVYKYIDSPEPSSPRTPSPTLEDLEADSMDAESWQQIGLARFATDHVTFAFLTDVYVEPAHRAGGLGSWLIACCGEWMDAMPHLRRAMLMASEGVGKAYYEKAFGMKDVAEPDSGLVCMSKRGPGSALLDREEHH